MHVRERQERAEERAVKEHRFESYLQVSNALDQLNNILKFLCCSTSTLLRVGSLLI